MTNLVHSFVRANLRKVILFFSLLASFSLNAQNGNPIPNYTYLGPCTVDGQTHHYYLSNFALPWLGANAAATTVAGGGGYLATLTSADENNCVTTALVAKVGTHTYNPNFPDYGNPNNPWIGYMQPAGSTEPAGGFTWANGEDCSNFTNWHPGLFGLTPPEPNNFPPAEDYAQLLTFSGVAAPNVGGGAHLGKWNDWFGDRALRFIVEFGPNPCLGDDGCSHGYWKNHEQSWAATGYSLGQTLESVFDVPNTLGMDAVRLDDALELNGGSGVAGAARNLFKQAVAALLNAAHPGVDYPLTTAQVIAQVNAALATNNRSTILALAETLDGHNNLGCPLNGHEAGRRPNPDQTIGSFDREFAISGYPNPSRNGFNLRIDGAATEKVTLRVTDITGRLIDQKVNVAANQVISLGQTFKAGVYYVEVTQGAKKQNLKLVKQ